MKPTRSSTSVLTEKGGSVAAIASGVSKPASVADCDRALALLRVAVRVGSVESRELAWLQVDVVLDLRLELADELARSGAQS